MPARRARGRSQRMLKAFGLVECGFGLTVSAQGAKVTYNGLLAALKQEGRLPSQRAKAQERTIFSSAHTNGLDAEGLMTLREMYDEFGYTVDEARRIALQDQQVRERRALRKARGL